MNRYKDYVMFAETESERKRVPNETMGRRIASRRALLDMTGGQLAAEVGVSREWISAIEHDRTKAITAATLVKIAKALGVTETWILHGDSHASAA